MSIKIVSDFVDYYDKAMNLDSNIVHERMTNGLLSKGLALDKIRKAGIKTIDVKQVSSQPYDVDRLLVYTDTSIHGKEGKKLLDRHHAEQVYRTYPSSVWYHRENGITLTIINVGSRRIALYYKAVYDIPYVGNLIKSEELDRGICLSLGEPVYSIDYIIVNGEWVAVDYNNIVKLSDFGIQGMLSASEACNEIRDAIIGINKVKEIM